MSMPRKMLRPSFYRVSALAALLIVSAGGYFIPATVAQNQPTLSYQELLDRSEKEKKGLMFYVKGQTIAGVFVKRIGSEAIEIRNQAYGRLIIRIDSIDAVAMN
ncbi:MAG TPA: hypothetical protein VNT76_18590 [Candidatus Binatus sp.]|nr:hypothetical protein [Candidatus Binatus sp.]